MHCTFISYLLRSNHNSTKGEIEVCGKFESSQTNLDSEENRMAKLEDGSGVHFRCSHYA